MLVEVVRLLLFPALMAFAAASDLLNMTISNRISLALVAGFAVLAVVCGLSPQTIAAHAATGLLVLAIGFALFARGLVGGGDAKLAAAAALWLVSVNSPIMRCSVRCWAVCSPSLFLQLDSCRCRPGSQDSPGPCGCINSTAAPMGSPWRPRRC